MWWLPRRSRPPRHAVLFYANTDLDQADAGYDVAPDGTFLLNQRVNDAGQPVTVVIGWERLLGSR